MENKRAELIKKMYEFGFEVGLKNHSEVGWVLREYNTIMENAQKLGIKSPEIYYQDGKLKGKTSREQSHEVRASVKEADITKKGTVTDIKVESSDIIKEFDDLQSKRKPSLNELPNLVKQTKYTEMPQLVKGFKSIRRR
jgi:hypothetical protein